MTIYQFKKYKMCVLKEIIPKTKIHKNYYYFVNYIRIFKRTLTDNSLKLSQKIMEICSDFNSKNDTDIGEKRVKAKCFEQQALSSKFLVKLK